MCRHSSLLIVLLISILSSELLDAQIQRRSDADINAGSMSVWVTAAAGKEQVRFASIGLVRRMRLEVINQAGDKVFDSEFHDGTLLDWKMEDVQGSRLPDGLYGCMVTVEDFKGQSTYRRVAFWLKDGVPVIGNSERKAVEAETSAEVQESVTILSGNDPLPITLLAHDGRIGSIVSGKGALSFRIGDIFSGSDVEHMRLTPEGNLGIGVREPAARLDVAGLIRTSEGIQFPDGTIQKTAADLNVFGAGQVWSNSRSGAGALNGFEGTTATFYGSGSGASNTTGSSLAFFGWGTGNHNTTGYWNSFLGDSAGYWNTTGNYNS